MEEVKLYPMLTKENTFLGLEAIDFLMVALVYLIVFLWSKELLFNFAVLVMTYVFLRLYKKNKPPHYTKNLIRFWMLPAWFTQAREIF